MPIASPFPELATALSLLFEKYPPEGGGDAADALEGLVFMYPRPTEAGKIPASPNQVFVEAITPEHVGIAAILAGPRPRAEQIYAGTRAAITQAIARVIGQGGRDLKGLDVCTLTALSVLREPPAVPLGLDRDSTDSWVAQTTAGEWLQMRAPPSGVPEAIAIALGGLRELVVESSEVGGEQILSPPPMLNTANLIATASEALRLSPEIIMSEALNLFHAGMITYPITESRIPTEGRWQQLALLARHKNSPISDSIHPWEEVRPASLGPGPIVPTGLDEPLVRLSEDALQLQRHILKHTLVSMMPPGVVQPVRLTLQGPTPALASLGHFSGTVYFAPGTWREVLYPDTVRIAPHTQSSLVKLRRYPIRLGGLAQRQWRVSDLMSYLDTEELGSAESIASLVPMLSAAGLLLTKKRDLKLSAKGQRAMDLFAPRLRLLQPTMAKVIEEGTREILHSLDAPERAARLVRVVESMLHFDVRRLPGLSVEGPAGDGSTPPAGPGGEPLAGTGEQCPQCAEGYLVTRTTRAPPVRQFLSCNDQACTYVKWPETRSEAEPLPGHGAECPECRKGQMTTRAVRENPGRRFLSCNRYPECKKSIWPVSLAAAESEALPDDGRDCPACGIGTLQTMVSTSKVNSGRKFLQCTRSEHCSHKVYPADQWPERAPKSRVAKPPLRRK